MSVRRQQTFKYRRLEITMNGFQSVLCLEGKSVDLPAFRVHFRQRPRARRLRGHEAMQPFENADHEFVGLVPAASQQRQHSGGRAVKDLESVDPVASGKRYLDGVEEVLCP